jgi:hypothetical protein
MLREALAVGLRWLGVARLSIPSRWSCWTNIAVTKPSFTGNVAREHYYLNLLSLNHV